MTDPNCIFCKIALGQIPCHKLHEDPHVIAFLDIGPLSRGHCLVVPKQHFETLDQMPPQLVAACARVLPTLGGAVMSVVNAKESGESGAEPPEAPGLETRKQFTGWNVLQNNGKSAGQAVGHVHFHIIPRTEGDALGFRWPAGKLDGEEAKKRVEAIKTAMK